MHTFTPLHLYFLYATTTLAASVSLGQYTEGRFHSDPSLPGVSVAWLGGAEPCTKHIVLTGANISPCGVRFTVSNDITLADLHFEGCGGDLQLFQGDNFLSNCGFEPSDKFFCGPLFDCNQLTDVKQVFGCSFNLASVQVEAKPVVQQYQELKIRMDSMG